MDKHRRGEGSGLRHTTNGNRKYEKSVLPGDRKRDNPISRHPTTCGKTITCSGDSYKLLNQGYWLKGETE